MDQQQKLLFNKPIKQNLAKYLKDKEVILVGPAPYLENSAMGSQIDSFDVVARLKSGYPVPDVLKKDLGTRIDLWYTNLKLEQNQLNSTAIDEMEKNNLKTIVFPYPLQYERNDVFKMSVVKLISILKYNFKKGIETIQKHFKRRNKKCPFDISYDTSSLYFQNLEKIIGCRPTTGMLAIMDLLQYDIKKLQLIGFTFRCEVLREQERHSGDAKQFNGDANKLNGLYSKYYKSDKAAIRSWQKTLANKTHEIKKELVFLKELRKIDNRVKVDSYLYKILENI